MYLVAEILKKKYLMEVEINKERCNRGTETRERDGNRNQIKKKQAIFSANNFLASPAHVIAFF